ncbi:carboxypeptidase-like regulatory domain-containing protein [candidate division KSB1 bacterium]|nr:carboxypeptidase-like regulatory domain-containing protein [candidate division KSB1 bacterium]
MKTITVILALCVLPMYMEATGQIAGKIIDGSTRQRLAGVNVRVRGTDQGAATDSAGVYWINHIPVGSYSLEVTIE